MQRDPATESTIQAVLEPRRFLRWVYLGRVVIATSIFVAAVAIWLIADREKTLIATLSFASAIAFTAYSFLRTEVNRRRTTLGFLYAQFGYDLLLITGVVHITGGAASQFAGLYILVNACAALLLPIGSSLLLATLGSALYVGDAFLVSDGDVSLAVVLQLVVFTLVALGTGYIAARLQEAGVGRERLQAELTSVRLRAADILANIRSAIITVDDGGVLLYANPMASDLLGADLEVRLGTPVLPLLQQSAPVVAEALALHIREQRLANRLEGSIERDGRVIPLGVTTTAVSGDLRQAGGATTAIFQDISDQKRIESLNLRAQRLEAVAELSASLAHEIKNPLAAIRSAVEQMSRRKAATDDERALGGLIVRESDRLSRLLSEFLDFARVQVVRGERVDLSALVRGAVALAGTHPDRPADSTLATELPAEPVLLAGDEDILHRALFNLVLNALQASPSAGTVRVRLRVLRPAELPAGVPFQGAAAAIEVTDEGSGIPADIHDRLFEPFATTKPGGTGLGLAIVHRSIEAHRGVVLVDTDAAGTRFTVLLPCEPAPSGVARE